MSQTFGGSDERPSATPPGTKNVRRGVLLSTSGFALFLSLWATSLEFNSWTHSALFSGAVRVVGALCVVTALALSLLGVIFATFAKGERMADQRTTLLLRAQWVALVLLITAVVPWFFPHSVA